MPAVSLTDPANTLEPADGPPRPLTRRTSLEPGLPWLWIVAAVFLVAVPVAGMLWRSLLDPDTGAIGLHNYAAVLSEAGVPTAVFNSLWIGLATTAASLVIGVPFAFLVSRTDMPGRRLFRFFSATAPGWGSCCPPSTWWPNPKSGRCCHLGSGTPSPACRCVAVRSRNCWACSTRWSRRRRCWVMRGLT